LEVSGGYKGYGLSMLVEIFCGILGNADYGPNIRRWKDTTRIANLVIYSRGIGWREREREGGAKILKEGWKEGKKKQIWLMILVKVGWR